MNFPLFPTEASKVAQHTDYLYCGMICLSLMVLAAVFGPIIFFSFRYRRGTKVNREPPHLPELKIELTWTFIPTAMMMCFFAWGAEQYLAIERPPRDGMPINVVAKQWMWKIEHPEGNREINELHVPVGRIIDITLASQDVIHSFFLPEMRVKQDVVPGRYTHLWFKADKIGRYHLFCSEYCGTHHSAMRGWLYAMAPADYQRWLTKGEPGSTLAQAGERLFRQYGCSGCHLNSSVVRAPPLEGLYGKPVPLSTGEIVTADDGYLRDSILLPAKDIVAGYTNDMPSFQGHVSEDQLVELIAYIRSIASQPPASVQ